MSLKMRYAMAFLFCTLPLALCAQTAPVRLALQYWIRGDYPNYPNGGHYKPVWVDGYYDDEQVWDYDLNEYVFTGNKVWVDGYYEDQWVEDYLADGLYGSRWDTHLGTFGNPTISSSTGYDPSATDRGTILSAFLINDTIYLKPWAYAPSGNCSSFEYAVYHPSGGLVSRWPFDGINSSNTSNSLTSTGVYKIDIKYQNATGMPTAGTVSYHVSVGVPLPPVFQTQPGPATQTVTASSTVSYTYAAMGIVTGTQWYFGGQPIVGATFPTLTLTNVQSANAGSYTVVIRNDGGSATSIPVSLAVAPSPPRITVQPASKSAFTGPPTTFSVTAVGSTPLTYQWLKNATQIPGATGASYTIASVASTDSGSYSVMVSNSVGEASSSSAVLSVNPSPPIRLAIQYWLPGDYPNYPNGGHYVPVWSEGHWDHTDPEIDTDLYDSWDGSYIWFVDPDGNYQCRHESYYHSPTWYWHNGEYVDQWVQDYSPDGLYGSRWNTSLGSFGDPRTGSSTECTMAESDRGYIIGMYQTNQTIYFRGVAFAPGGNCSNFKTIALQPDGSEFQTWLGSSADAYFWPSGNGTSRIKISYSDAKGTSLSSAAVTYEIAVGNNSASQTITFPPLSSHGIGETFLVPGTASSGLPVSYSIVSGPATVSGNVVTGTGEGYVTIRASQTGGYYNGLSWAAATPVERIFAVRGRFQTIAFPAIANYTLGDAPFSLNATASSGLPVEFIVTGPASISGGAVTLKSAGTVSVTAAQPGNAEYLPAAAVSRTFSVGKANQTVAFGPISNRILGERPFMLSGSASSGLAVVYSVTSGPAVVRGATVVATDVGMVTIAASQPGDSNFNAATTVSQSFAVSADTTPPSAPGSPSVASVTADSVSLKWTASADNIAVVGYQLYRDGVLKGTSGGTSATMTGLSPQMSYQFTIRAFDSAGNLSGAAIVTVMTLPRVALDSDGDGIPDSVEDQLGTNETSKGTTDSSEALKLRIHRPE